MKEKEFEEPLAQSSVSLKLELIQQRCSQLMDDPDALELTLDEVSPGRFETVFDGPEIGLYRLANDDHATVIGLGPASPVEFEETLASGEALAPLIEATNGGVRALEDGVPRIRAVRDGLGKASPAEVGACEVGSAEVGLAEVRAEVGLAEIGVDERGSIEPGQPQVELLQPARRGHRIHPPEVSSVNSPAASALHDTGCPPMSD